MNSGLISIIIPIYNTEDYLDRCIESVVNQTYNKLEIILVDDGSSDNSPKICDIWVKKDNRIKVVHKENGGVSSARNIGLEYATGDFITFIDSDDWIDTDYIELLYNAIVKYDADVAGTGFTLEHINGEREFVVENNIVLNNNVLSEFLYDNIRNEACSKIYKKSLLKDICFDSNIGFAEDAMFNYEVFKRCKKYCYVATSKYHYLQNSGNSSTTDYISDKRAESYKVYLKFVEDCKNDNALYSAAIYRFTISTLAVLSRVMIVPEYSDKYFEKITDSLNHYYADIVKNKALSIRSKAIVTSIRINRELFKKFVTIIRHNLKSGVNK